MASLTFDSNSAGRNLPYGAVAGALQVGDVSYNGFRFPPALKSRITVVPEYDRSGRVVKYLTIAINIEFIMTDPRFHPVEAGVSTSTRLSTPTINNLMARLGQSGQRLSFTAQGFGSFVVDNLTGPEKDLDFGPKPQVIEFQPLGGGNSFLVQWLCVTRVSPCVTQYNGDFVEYNYSVNWSIDEAGYMDRTIDGLFEFPGYHQMDIVSSKPARASVTIPAYFQQVQKAKYWLTSTFPLVPNFKRSYSFAIDEAKKVLKFTIKDEQIHSLNAMPPGVADINISETFSSDIDAGFREWKVTYSGEIETVDASAFSNPFEAKQLAWYWLGLILKYKRDCFESVLQTNVPKEERTVIQKMWDNETNKETAAEREDELQNTPSLIPDNTDEYLRQNYSYLLFPSSISFTDNLYSNSISFTVGYTAIITSSLLAKAFCLFKKLEVSGLYGDTCIKYQEQAAIFKERLYPYTDQEVLVDICNPLQPINSSYSNSGEATTNQDSSFLSIRKPKDGSDCAFYKQQVEHRERTSSVKGKKIKKTNRAGLKDEVISTGLGPAPKELSYNPLTYPKFDSSEGFDPPLDDIKVNTGSESEKYVTVRGVAGRFSGPIAPPTLLSVGGINAIKDGEDIVTTDIIKMAITGTDGQPTDLYVTRWEKNYILTGTPNNFVGVGTGDQRRFS